MIVVLFAIPIGFVFAVLAVGYCKLRRHDLESARPVIMLSGLAGFLLGAFTPVFLGSILLP